MKKKRRQMDVNRLIALSFLALILLGSLLLCLPIASKGAPVSYLTGLFTATSAVCVTGLTVADTWSQWTGFGQAVLLCLIEIGGLGFMSAASILVFLFRGRFGMRDQMLMAQSIGVRDQSRVLSLQKWVLALSLGTEAAGALALTLRFLPRFGFLRALKLGVFHAVSAYCNAGFDILGFLSPGGSLAPFAEDGVVLGVLSCMIISGSLGFLVWEELFRVRNLKKISVYSRLALIATGVLLLGGTALIAVFEWHNPDTIGGMAPGKRVLASFFQSVTLRTAGFAALDQAKLTEAGKGVSLLLMFVGGSSGSTAGGMKTVTLVVLLLFLWSRLRGKSTVVVFHRTIPFSMVLNALTIFGVMILLSLGGAVFICFDSGAAFTDALYETVSAIATVGLSCSLPPRLHPLSKLLIILYKYFDRDGVLTLSLGFLRDSQTEPRVRYADAYLLIG